MRSRASGSPSAFAFAPGADPSGGSGGGSRRQTPETDGASRSRLRNGQVVRRLWRRRRGAPLWGTWARAPASAVGANPRAEGTIRPEPGARPAGGGPSKAGYGCLSVSWSETLSFFSRHTPPRGGGGGAPGVGQPICGRAGGEPTAAVAFPGSWSERGPRTKTQKDHGLRWLRGRGRGGRWDAQNAPADIPSGRATSPQSRRPAFLEVSVSENPVLEIVRMVFGARVGGVGKGKFATAVNRKKNT